MSQAPSESPVVPSTAPTIAPSCPACGYSLRALESERCPECGLRLTAEMRVASAIPWEHRAVLGAWRAYWGTAALVIFRPKDCLVALELPINFRPARQFWWLTTAGVSALMITPLAVQIFSLVSDDVVRLLALGFFAAIPISVLLATGAITYDCHPPGRSIGEQNRTIALGYYYAALTWPLAAVVAFFSATLWWAVDSYGPQEWFLAAAPLAVLCALGFWSARWVELVNHTRTGGRRWFVVGWTAGSALTLAALLPFLLPLLLLFFVVLIGSLN